MFNKLSQIRNSVLISKRLKGLVVIIALLIIVLGSVSVRSVSSLNVKINEINERYLKSLVKLSSLIENIYSLLIESHIIDEKSLSENSIANSLNIDLLNTYLIEYEKSIIDDAQRVQYDGFLLELQNYLSILKEVNSLELQGKYELAVEIRSEREIASFKKLQSIIKSMIEYNTKGIETSNNLINILEQKSINQIFLLSFLILFLAMLIATFLIRDISHSLKALTSNLSILQKGEIPDSGLIETGNELGQMASLTNALTRNLSELNRFAIDISKGNYSSEYQYAGKNDLLGKALVNLRNSLRVSKEEDEKRKIEDERRNWTNKGHAIFGEILRQRSHELGKLTDDIIKNLVYYLKANQGGLFLLNDSGDISKIELVSAFAYDRKKFFERNINIGDGLIGTVALERNTVYLKEIPDDYIEIESGLGDARPKSLLIVPLKFEEDILGIVEIASFKEFQDFEIKFIEEVAQSIASTLLTAKINARTQQLLDESRKQSEILAAQEIEARQNMEEMRATQELAQRREADLSGIISAVDNTLMKGEYEIDGTLISVNNRHLQTMGYQLKEIKGKNIEMFVPKDELEHFRKIWANVVAGNPRQLEVRRRTKTGEVLWLINQYTPVTDVSGKISKVLYFAHDITKYKRVEDEDFKYGNLPNIESQEFEKRLKLLKKSEEEFNVKSKSIGNVLETIESDLITFEFDIEGRIIKVNQQFENLFKTSIAKLSGKKLSDVFLVNDSEEVTSLNYKEIKDGISINAINKYSSNEGATIWLHEFYSVVMNEENEPSKILAICYDITKQKLAEQKNENLLIEAKSFSDALLQKETEMQKALDDLHNLSKGNNNDLDENQKIIESFNQYFPRLDIDTDQKFISTNKEFSDKYKYSERELIGKPLNRLIAPENREQFDMDFNSNVGNQIFVINTKIITKDSEIVDVNLHIVQNSKEIRENSKFIIFINEKTDVQNVDNEILDLQIKIDKKKKELQEIISKIENFKTQSEDKFLSTTGNYPENEANDLYNLWLLKMKKES